MLRRSGGGDCGGGGVCWFSFVSLRGASGAVESSMGESLGLDAGGLGNSVRIWTTSRIVGRAMLCSSTQSIAT